MADPGHALCHISFFVIFPSPQKYPRLELHAAWSKGRVSQHMHSFYLEQDMSLMDTGSKFFGNGDGKLELG